MTGEWNICIGPVEQWRYYFYLLFVRIVVSPWLLTWLANYKRASRSGRFFCCYRIFPFLIRILTFWNRKYKYYCLYFSFISPLYPSFITFLWRAFCDRWPLKLHSQFCCFESESKKKVVSYVGISSVSIK